MLRCDDPRLRKQQPQQRAHRPGSSANPHSAAPPVSRMAESSSRAMLAGRLHTRVGPRHQIGRNLPQRRSPPATADHQHEEQRSGGSATRTASAASRFMRRPSAARRPPRRSSRANSASARSSARARHGERHRDVGHDPARPRRSSPGSAGSGTPPRRCCASRRCRSSRALPTGCISSSLSVCRVMSSSAPNGSSSSSSSGSVTSAGPARRASACRPKARRDSARQSPPAHQVERLPDAGRAARRAAAVSQFQRQPHIGAARCARAAAWHLERRTTAAPLGGERAGGLARPRVNSPARGRNQPGDRAAAASTCRSPRARRSKRTARREYPVELPASARIAPR